MAFFLALAKILLGQRDASRKQLEKSLALLDDSEYWRERFEQFGLIPIANHFPQNPAGVYEALVLLRTRTFDSIPNKPQYLVESII